MADLAQIGLSIVMVLGPVIGYVDQYFIIKRKKSSAGFNSLTCGILLFAKIGKRFDTTLLVQSLVMIAAQLILLEIVVRYNQPSHQATRYDSISSTPTTSTSSISSANYSNDNNEDDASTSQENPAVGFNFLPQTFWAWNHYLSYINCILCFTTVVGVLFILLSRYSSFVETIGVISLGIESTLPLPQCISNWKRRSTFGFSLLVIGTWVLGDSFKVFYFLHTNSPVQFIICGSIQVAIDSFIVFEFILFSAKVKKWLGISRPLLIDGQVGDEASEPLLG
ncbi:hypothetical protein F4703DRAFT_1831779 [Phycomyces blakesleeanus]